MVLMIFRFLDMLLLFVRLGMVFKVSVMVDRMMKSMDIMVSICKERKVIMWLIVIGVLFLIISKYMK